MRFLKIYKYPARILRKKCLAVEKITENEKTLFENMHYTMRLANGIGLAAPQIGINKKLIVADIGQGIIKLADPEILDFSGEDKMTECCLSVPGAAVEVTRAFNIQVGGLNERGKRVEITASGLLARVLQHEIDHLNGKIIIDYLNNWDNLKYKLTCLLLNKK
jgi:peptide deformylase